MESMETKSNPEESPVLPPFSKILEFSPNSSFSSFGKPFFGKTPTVSQATTTTPTVFRFKVPEPVFSTSFMRAEEEDFLERQRLFQNVEGSGSRVAVFTGFQGEWMDEWIDEWMDDSM